MAGPSRVGELRLRARLPAALADAAPAVRTRLERETVVGVLEALERRVHAMFGADAILHVRHVSLAWTLGVDALGDAAALARLADDLGRDLFAAVAQQPPTARLRPRDPIAVVFSDEHHRVAAALADAADGHAPHWSTEALGDAAMAWSALVAAGAVAITATIEWLARMERVEAALTLADEPSLTAVAATAPHVAGVVALVRARRAAIGSGVPPATPAEVAPRDATAAPGGAHEARRPSAATERGQPPPPVAAGPTRDDDARDDDAPAPALPPPAMPAAATASTHQLHAAGEPGHQAAPNAAAATRGRIAGDGDGDGEVTGPPGLSVDTAAAGLFYLIGRVLEIELAERLWAAGVDEARALAAIVRPLVDDDDPAWTWFGGFDRAPPPPPIAAWAIAEVREGVTHALGHRLVRFGVSTTPATLAQQLDELARTAPPIAHGPELAPLTDFATAALATIVAARLRRPPSHALLRSLVRRPGRLVRTDDALHVILPATALDIEHRRAGLDQDPGYVPWLRRRVTLEFIGMSDL